MGASDFRRSASLADPRPQLLEELDKRLSAAQQADEELDEIPLVIAWTTDGKGEAEQGREGFSEARVPVGRPEMQKRMGSRQSRYKGYAASIAALLVLVVVGVCAASLNDQEGHALQKTVQEPVAYDRAEVQSTTSAASSVSGEVVGTLEVDKVDLVSSEKGARVLEAFVTVYLPAHADVEVTLSFENSEGSEVAEGVAESGIGGPFVIRCPLPETWGDDGDASPLQPYNAFVRTMKEYVLVLKGPGVEERAKIDLGGLASDEVDELVASEYEENGGVVVLDLVAC